MWKLFWGYIVGRMSKQPPGTKRGGKGTTTTPTAPPAPTPTPTPTPTPVPEAAATDLDTLRLQGYIPYYANVPTGPDLSASPSNRPTGAGDYPNAIAGESVEDYWPNVGGREDLAKPMPGWMTRASMLGTASRAWAQMELNTAAHSRFAIHFNDNTGAPHNIDNAPSVTLDSRYAGTVLSDTSALSFPGTVDDAHHVQLAYLQYWLAATVVEKELCLRVMQWQAQWPMLRYGTSNGLGTLQLSAEQVRGEAHCLMNMALAAVATTHWETLGLTPVTPLLSANYLHRKLTNELLRLKQITVLSSDPLTQNFRIYPNHTMRFWDPEQYALWMADMVTITLGWLARMGFTVAKEIFDWAVVGVKARHDTGLGWRHVYKVQLIPNPGDAVVSTWAQMYAAAIVDPTFDVGDMMHGILCLDASMGGNGAARAAVLRAEGFTYWQIGYFFDPTVRAIPMTQAVVSTDAQFTPYIVTDLPVSGVDSMGREYLTTTPGTSIYFGAITHNSSQLALVHTGDDYVWLLWNGVNRFKGYFKIYFSDNWHYDMATKAFVAP